MDFRYAIRVLLKSRGNALIALAALALGIGANSAIFSVVRAVLLSPLPYHDPDRLVTILQKGSNPLGPADFVDIRKQAHSFEAIAAAEAWSASLAGSESPEEIVGMHVSEDLFRVLGVQAMRGRVLVPGDFAPGAPRALVISYGLWQRNFGGEPAAVGRQVSLSGDSYTIVGIMPRGFYFAPFWVTQAEMWAPIDLTAAIGNRGGGSLRGFARLAKGASQKQAQADLDQIANSLSAAYPMFDAGIRFFAEPLPEKAIGNVRPMLQVMLGAVGMVLLIACANVANLALARATARRKEIAVRVALGASRTRIARQFLVESVTLSLAGGALGLALAQWGVIALQSMLRPDRGEIHARLVQADGAGLDGGVLLFTLALSIASGVLFGLAPAIAAGRGGVNAALKDSARGTSAGGGKLRRTLVAAEIAVALVLVIGAGLLMRSFLKLRAVDPGFDPHDVATMTVSLAGRPELVGPRRDALYRRILERVAAIPGVRGASMINHLPIAGDVWGFPYWIEGEPLPPPGKFEIATYRSCRPDYFATMRAPIVAGRDFNDRDAGDAPAVAIVNEVLAKRIGDPIGKRIAFSDPRNNPKWITIVGVVRNMSQSWADPAGPEAYVPYWQDPRLTASTRPFASYMTLVARGASVEAVKQAVLGVDRGLTLSQTQTLEHAIGNATWSSRFSLIVATAFSGLALVLAIIGIYGVMAYEVAQRTQEIGIRIALGAGSRGVIALIARQSLPVAAAGIACGLAAAAALVRLMRTMLYKVDALDPATFAAVAAVMMLVATLAALVPASRAMRVDPMVALRNE